MTVLLEPKLPMFTGGSRASSLIDRLYSVEVVETDGNKRSIMWEYADKHIQ